LPLDNDKRADLIWVTLLGYKALAFLLQDHNILRFLL